MNTSNPRDIAADIAATAALAVNRVKAIAAEDFINGTNQTAHFKLEVTSLVHRIEWLLTRQGIGVRPSLISSLRKSLTGATAEETAHRLSALEHKVRFVKSELTEMFA